jgi:hypothetical protein
MAKKKSRTKKISKSQAIRDFAAKNPKAGPTEIAAALKRRGFKVTPAYASSIKTMDKRKRRKGGKSASRAGKGGEPSFELAQLLHGKKLVEKLGSTERARAALSALGRLQ